MASRPITSWQIEMKNVEAVTDFLFLGSKITEDGDWNHEIRRQLFLGKKSMTNLDSVLKSKGVILPTKVHIVKATVFPLVTYSWESWTIKNAEHQTIDAFELWYWRRLLRVPWTTRRSKQSILKEISPENSLEGLLLKLQYFGHLMWTANSLEKNLMLEKTEWRRGQQRDEMVEWNHRWNGYELGQTPGDDEEQDGLACNIPWGCEELDMTWQVNNMSSYQ